MTDVLIDVTSELIFENEFDSLTDENYTDLIETILMLIDHNTGEKKGDGEIFVDEVIDTEEIYDLVCVQFENLFINNSDEDYIYDIIEDAVDIYNSFKRPIAHIENRTAKQNDLINTTEYYTKIIEYLRTRPQPPQRTDAWYKFRHNLITASNAYKAFESQSSINQLIYEKCQPLKTSETDSFSFVNVKSPFHWGQKYEI